MIVIIVNGFFSKFLSVSDKTRQVKQLNSNEITLQRTAS